tara:strand:- start:126 stop:908 length:783 start_codon:yes stop_codon:yes gene_type:complete
MIKYLKIIICFALIFNFNNKAEALSGVGPIKFNNYTMDSFFAYLRGDGNPSGDVGARKGTPLAFAVNPEGTTSFYYYCPLKFGSGACKPGDTLAVSNCSKRSKARGGSRCKLFARGYKVVWNGTNIKFSRKFDEQVVRSVFKQNGWYGSANQEINSLAKKITVTAKHKTDKNIFINRSANNEDQAKKLALDACKLVVSSWSSKPEEMDNCYIASINGKEIKTKFTKKDNTVEQLQDIKKMLDEGLITEAEFKKLKEEILN